MCSEKIKKGDTILYHFAFKIQEAKVVKVFGDYIKVRHMDAFLFGFTEIISTSCVISVSRKKVVDKRWIQ